MLYNGIIIKRYKVSKILHTSRKDKLKTNILIYSYLIVVTKELYLIYGIFKRIIIVRKIYR